MARFALGRVKEMDLSEQEKEKLMELISQAKAKELNNELGAALKLYIQAKDFLNNIKKQSKYDKFECLQTLEGHEDRVNAVLETRDAKYIISGGSDNNIIVRDRNSGQQIEILKEHKGLIHALKETEDGQYILSTSYDGTIKMWDKETWECVQTFIRKEERDRDKVVMDVVEIDDQTLASISNAVITIWDKETGEEKESLYPEGMAGTFYSLEKIANKESLLITSDLITRIYSLTSNDWDLGFGEDTKGSSVAKESNDHKFIFYVTSYNAAEPYKIRMWNQDTWDVEAEFKGHQKDVKGMLQTKDGKHLITLANDKTIRVWDIATQECLKVFELDDFVPTCIAESANGDIIVGGADKTIKIFGQKK